MIVKSFWTREDQPQACGRFRITETHIDQLGVAYVNCGLYAKDYVPDEELTIRAQIIDASLKGAEIAQAIDEMTAKIQPEPIALTQVDPNVAATLKYATAQELEAQVAK